MANTIDELMDLDPLQMTTEDIDKIIAHHRNIRAKGGLGKAQKESGPKLTLDIKALGLGKKPGDEPEMKRRI